MVGQTGKTIMEIPWIQFIENNWNRNIKENNSKSLDVKSCNKKIREDLLGHCTSTEAAVAFFIQTICFYRNFH
jgi:hypothetical protein